MSRDRQDDRDPSRRHDNSLLDRISTESVRVQKEAFGKGPSHAKSYMFDDLLMVVMRDSLTTAEKTMLGFGQADLVRNFRQQFHNAMTDRLIAIIEEMTHRKVLTYQSQILFDPDLVVQLFVFDRAAEDHEQFTTAEIQAGD